MKYFSAEPDFLGLKNHVPAEFSLYVITAFSKTPQSLSLHLPICGESDSGQLLTSHLNLHCGLPASEIALAPASFSLLLLPSLSYLRLRDQKASPVAVPQSQITSRQCQDSTHLQPFSSESLWGKSTHILSMWSCFPDHLLLPSLSVISNFHPLVRRLQTQPHMQRLGEIRRTTSWGLVGQCKNYLLLWVAGAKGRVWGIGFT